VNILPTQLFFLFVLSVTALRLWLTMRQIAHVSMYRNQVPPRFATQISLEAHQKAADYTVAKNNLALIHTIVEAALLLAFTSAGLLDACAKLVQQWFPDGSYFYGLALFTAFGLIGFVVDLPFSLYRTFVVDARFGFNKMTPALYVTDLIKQTLLAVLIGAPLLFVVLWLMAQMGERWWLWVWLFWMGFNLLVMIAYPTVIAPLFNKFTPLADDTLRARIDALLARCGFRSSGVFVMDGSKRSTQGNAYFTGFGAAKRIVFFDTLIDRLQPAEIEAVLAHELGHFKRRHIWKSIAVMSLLSLGFLWLLGVLMQQPHFYSTLGIHHPGTAMALILFMLVLPVVLFPLSPLLYAFSRKHEYEADAFAAQQTRASDLVEALVKLYRDNASTLTPDPLHSLFHDSHPPATLRIARLDLV
jgi:STE24 endopeptidase